MFESEWRRMQRNLDRLIHDHFFTRRILDVPDTEWQRTNDRLKDRLGSFQSSNNEEGFKVYFKGFVSVEMSSAGIGVAIYDTRDRCVFELRKTFLIAGIGRRTDGDVVEIRAFVECLRAALSFGLKRVDVFCDNKSVYEYLTGKEKPINQMTMKLVDALILIQRKIGYRVVSPLLTRRNNVKYVYKLAKEAVPSQPTKLAENVLEQCSICLEHVCKVNIFSINKCLHRYCYSCMNKHAESKLLEGQLPECPHENCKSKLEIESCKKWLSRSLYDIMSSRIKEASIHPTDRVYCPFSKCSVLMSKTKLQHAAASSLFQETEKRKCFKCHGLFCINCKVPWHDKYKCTGYVKDFPNQFADEETVKSLATSKRWRQCIKCMHMIELAAGCHHISCRCGYEFCYRCGSVWINRKATCSCPLWDLGYILYDA